MGLDSTSMLTLPHPETVSDAVLTVEELSVSEGVSEVLSVPDVAEVISEDELTDELSVLTPVLLSDALPTAEELSVLWSALADAEDCSPTDEMLSVKAG